MDRNDVYQLLLDNFGFEPTKGQAKVISDLSAFIITEKERATYLLRGYAGTGKTTLISTLVKTLPLLNMSYQLLAPTGRAAKVMSSYTGKSASTIHRKLYRFQAMADGEFKMTRAENKSKNTIFIVDECSMISDNGDGFSWTRSLLDDLIEYVFSGSCCKLLLIGDSAQLPPVGSLLSPAMDFNILRNNFNLTIATYEMKEVMRQALNSGILYNATNIRNKITLNNDILSYDKSELPILEIDNFLDIEKIDPMSFEELLWQCFGDKRNNNEAVVICRSNKRANMFNQAIRSRVLQEEGELSTGDKLMIVKNNYYWKQQSTNFLANGDMIEIMKINRFEEMYGFHFADVEIHITDYEEQQNLSVKIILETLHSDSPALSSEDAKKLYDAVEEDYMDITGASERRKAMKENPYYNALQVKFGYALTCHKTQGGQWDNVFIEAPYLAEGNTLEKGDLRWLYTALTRSRKKTYLVNFKDEWFI